MASGRVPKTKRIFFAMMWGKITVSSGINPLGASIRLVQASAWCKLRKVWYICAGMHVIKTIFLLTGLGFCLNNLLGQNQPRPIPLHRDAAWLYEQSAQDTGKSFLTGVRPFSLRDLQMHGIMADSFRSPRPSEHKFNHRSLITFAKPDWNLQINPLFDVTYLNDRGDNYDIPFMGGLGWDISLDLGKDWNLGYRHLQYFSDGGSDFYKEIVKPRVPLESFNPQADAYALRYLPGYGVNLNLNNNKSFYESRFTEAWVSWAPHRFVQIMAGQGRHFFGEGYRSLTLSDNAYNYPYLRITTTFWKIKYTNLFAAPQNLLQLDMGDIRTTRKSLAVQHLEAQLSKRWFVHFFESVIWERTQDGGNKTWDINYLNPAVFYHPINYSLNSMGNALMALGLKYKAGSKSVFYGQLVLDDFNVEGLRTGNGFFQNKVGGQVGYKGFDLFNLKGFILLAELNMIRPYTYANRQVGISYSHQGQALAHPSGANLLEPVLILNYMRHGWTFELKSVMTFAGLDRGYTHLGSDILKDETWVDPYSYNNTFLQGAKTFNWRNDLRIAKLIHHPSMLTAEFLIGQRYLNAVHWSMTRNHVFIGLGIRCQLFNTYRDQL